jgi:hypothetical protein
VATSEPPILTGVRSQVVDGIIEVVPEPSTLTMLALATLAIVRQRRRRLS